MQGTVVLVLKRRRLFFQADGNPLKKKSRRDLKNVKAWSSKWKPIELGLKEWGKWDQSKVVIW